MSQRRGRRIRAVRVEQEERGQWIGIRELRYVFTMSMIGGGGARHRGSRCLVFDTFEFGVESGCAAAGARVPESGVPSAGAAAGERTDSGHDAARARAVTRGEDSRRTPDARSSAPPASAHRYSLLDGFLYTDARRAPPRPERCARSEVSCERGRPVAGRHSH